MIDFDIVLMKVETVGEFHPIRCGSQREVVSIQVRLRIVGQSV
jgi:hypothetical protein